MCQTHTLFFGRVLGEKLIKDGMCTGKFYRYEPLSSTVSPPCSLVCALSSPQLFPRRFRLVLDFIPELTNLSIAKPGVTRRSVLELAREWRELEGGVPLEVCERRLTMGEVVKASREGRVRMKRRWQNRTEEGEVPHDGEGKKGGRLIVRLENVGVYVWKGPTFFWPVAGNILLLCLFFWQDVELSS